MRKIIGVAVFCLVACSFFLTVQPAFGALTSDTIWNPKAGTEQLSINFTLQNGYSFGIYDYDNYGEQLTIFTGAADWSGDWTNIMAELNFIENSSTGTWTVKLNGSEMSLGDSSDFGFFFYDIVNGEIYDNYSYEKIFIEDKETYKLTWDNDGKICAQMIIGVHDVVANSTPGSTPTVPIPTAMLLLGSGLVGLAGFKRKMDN